MNPEERLEHLTQALALTPSQQQEIKPLLDAEAAKLRALHENTSLTKDQQREQFKTINQDADKQIEEVLTVDQVSKFEQIEHWLYHPGPPPPPGT